MTAAYWRLISQGLVARPDGGVRLLFNGGPDEASEDTIPVVVSYDADLRPDGDPVLLPRNRARRRPAWCTGRPAVPSSPS